MKRYPVLSQDQVELLRTLAATPATGIRSDQVDAHHVLLSRSLIAQTWDTALGHPTRTITEQGRYVLRHGRLREEAEKEAQRLAGDLKGTRAAPGDGTELVRAVTAAGGTLTLPDPGPQTRALWVRAYYHARHHGHVPTGYRLQLRGRTRDDLTLKLVPLETDRPTPSVPAPVSAVAVPARLTRPHPLVTATRQALGRTTTGTADTRGQPGLIPLHLSRPLLDRALRIMQGLITEAQHRGHTVQTIVTEPARRRDAPSSALVITIDGRAFPLEILERTSKQPHLPTDQELRNAQTKPQWAQKRIPKYDHVPDGRLMIDAPGSTTYPGRLYHCTDSSRAPLETRLGDLLALLEAKAAEARERRRQTEQDTERGLREWHDAVAEARQQRLYDLRLADLDRQLDARRKAQDIRDLCTALLEHPDTSPTTHRAQWIQWAQAHADRIDPVERELALPADTPPSTRALEPYLGPLITYRHPWPYQQHRPYPRAAASDDGDLRTR